MEYSPARESEANERVNITFLEKNPHPQKITSLNLSARLKSLEGTLEIMYF